MGFENPARHIHATILPYGARVHIAARPGGPPVLFRVALSMIVQDGGAHKALKLQRGCRYPHVHVTQECHCTAM